MDLGGWESWGRVLAALGAGAALGLRAEIAQRPAGLRTHILVATGAAVFCLTGAPYLGTDFSDPLRALQGVASGIGLVAAATVLKGERSVIGVTTAASIWLAAALGCDAALGAPLRALLLGTLLAVLSWVLRWVEVRWLGTLPREQDELGP